MKKINNILKGQALEKKNSLCLNRGNIPILISPGVLRRRGLGQIDLCYLDGASDLGHVLEIKMGGQMFDERRVSHKQMQRLYKAADWLSQVFNKSFIVRVISD